MDDDDDDDNFKIESAQPVSDKFCEPVPSDLESCNWSIISVFDC